MIALNLKSDTFPTHLPKPLNQTVHASPFDRAAESVLKKGQVIFNENNSRPHVYLVTKGFVKLSSFHDAKEMLEDYYQAGEMFNCEALFGPARGNLTAEAMTQMTTIKKIPVPVFQQAMKAHPTLLEEVLSSISCSLHRAQERLRRLTLLGSQQRVTHFLVNHVLHSGRKVGYEWVVKPAFTHQEMAYIAGTGRQTVTTVLNELRREGIVHFNRNYLIVRDMEALKAWKFERGE